uniref:Uncharacterized protein n=1 Tax=Arundo donax TaxID=35708 RepID=A0A0A9GGB1_ARUDO
MDRVDIIASRFSIFFNLISFQPSVVVPADKTLVVPLLLCDF